MSDLMTECGPEGLHVHSTICQCKLKQINAIAVKTLKDIAICRPALNKIKELSE